ncbi:MAG: hypothetical protein OKBPIBMD_02155 [Chlorobi bacterium]|nr:MAG: T9SS type A sorting domain-containing protein [Bacteroidota bacterium]KXK33925.1 MAG: 5'-nucleotidase [Chlorobi bacterium OLB6]MBV6464662.1 hypothetical protein [Chlorobiota bacterium]MBW7854060.1 T9SS type A sorting domain-containing protein [Candidatus Kapabacteria bacterium]QOJ26911.1 MAG: T9SS type A sorting domain-containing protein [Ignavibacteria bacterium]
MKLSLHVLGGLLLAATVLQAQQTFKLFTNPEADNQRPLFRTMETNITIPPAEVPVISAKSGSEVQALTYTAMYGTDFYPSWEAGDNTVFLYDHATNATFLFRPRRVFNPSGQLTGGRIDAYITTDDGANWATMELYNKPDRFLTFPRVGLVNANNAQTDPSKLEYIVFCSSFEKRGAEWPLIGGFGLFFPASGAFDYEMVQPENAPADLGWATTGSIVSVSSPNPGVYYADLLDKKDQNGSSQWGAYGTWGYDFEVNDFTASTMPDAWRISQFRVPSPTNLNSRMNSETSLDADADGKLYMVVNNILTSNPEVRVPMVSTSEDQGSTWTEFTVMPEALFSDYQQTQGWGSVVIFRQYDSYELLVTGRNRFSYFLRLADYGVNRDSLTNLHIVEVGYDNGAWSLTKVADLNGIPLEFFRQDSASGGAQTPNWIPSYQVNPRGHEIQAALTADGQNILLKWIDENPDLLEDGFSQIALFNAGGSTFTENEITGLFYTDIYFCHRPVNSSAWSSKVNITNDRVYDHGTLLPPVIKSLESVPIVNLLGFKKNTIPAQSTWRAPLSNLPEVILNATVDYRTPNVVQTAFFNALNPSSVNEQTAPAFHINTIAPNPATTAAEVTFTMDQPAPVRVEVYNVNGELVHTAYTGSLDAGIHGISVSTDSLPAGAYAVAITVGSKRSTQMLSVVR